MSQTSSIKPAGQTLLRTFERVMGDRNPAAEPGKEESAMLKKPSGKDTQLQKTFEFYGRNGAIREAGPHAAGKRFDHTV